MKAWLHDGHAVCWWMCMRTCKDTFRSWSVSKPLRSVNVSSRFACRIMSCCVLQDKAEHPKRPCLQAPCKHTLQKERPAKTRSTFGVTCVARALSSESSMYLSWA